MTGGVGGAVAVRHHSRTGPGRPDGPGAAKPTPTHWFRNQRVGAVPAPSIEAALRQPVTRRLLVTDAGYYPHAAHHLRTRPAGGEETIVMICIQGIGWVQTQGRSRTVVTPSTCVILPAGTPHAYGASPEHPWTIWWCHLRGSDVLEVPDLLQSRHEPAFLSLRSLDRTTALMEEIVTTLERGQTPAHLLAGSGAAWHLLSQIVVDRVLPEAGTPLERAIRYLEERTDSHVRVADLAALVGLSASHLSALFREATGGGVTAYHLALRMSRARALLNTTRAPVGEVARAVGYTDPLYFSRQFRKLHGTNPTAYRAQRKG